jgi:excisionase family DNA binding protein
MKQIYTSIDQLPIVLTADQLAQALGISRAGAYQLMHSKGFPTIRIGKRMVVPKEQLLIWMEEKLKEGNSLF